MKRSKTTEWEGDIIAARLLSPSRLRASAVPSLS